jgi:hypothetical protein
MGSWPQTLTEARDLCRDAWTGKKRRLTKDDLEFLVNVLSDAE